MNLKLSLKLITDTAEIVGSVIGLIKPKKESMPEEMLRIAEERIREKIRK